MPSSSQLKAKLPSNASDVDPVMLLNQINPCSKFVEMSRDVRNGATVFTISVDFNGASYVGSGEYIYEIVCGIVLLYYFTACCSKFYYF